VATKINIAIDGYSSCGKGTLAKFLSSSLGYRFIDSGSMYRAVTLFIIRRGINPAETEKVVNELNQIHISFKWDEEISRYAIFLNSNNVEKDIRTMEVASSVSQIAKISEVRSYLVARQRAMAWEKGVVMDGRDIGTVVLPDAELKIFMTARPEIRARRRLKELVDSGIDTTYDAVLANITQRDEIDILN
jgi:CMP/dCMP kinase